MGLRSRLERLESRAGPTSAEDETSARCEVLRLMTTDELYRYEEALARFASEGSFAEEDAPILLRVQELLAGIGPAVNNDREGRHDGYEA